MYLNNTGSMKLGYDWSATIQVKVCRGYNVTNQINKERNVYANSDVLKHSQGPT